LGQDFLTICADRDIEIQGFDLPEVDITRKETLVALPPCDVVIDCAAYTNVDGAEGDADAAYAINKDGAGLVARWCEEHSARMVFLSTDYIFDGTKGSAYVEEDTANPVNVYGRSKWAGEQTVCRVLKNALIVRTQALFGPGGRNFVEIVREKARADEPLRVVCDQMTCPTYTCHLVEGILHLLIGNKRGIVHMSSSESCTWYDFAVEIASRIGSQVEIIPVRSSEYASPARRPPYSVLDKSRYEAWVNSRMPSWEAGLDAYLAQKRSDANR